MFRLYPTNAALNNGRNVVLNVNKIVGICGVGKQRHYVLKDKIILILNIYLSSKKVSAGKFMIRALFLGGITADSINCKIF